MAATTPEEALLEKVRKILASYDQGLILAPEAVEAMTEAVHESIKEIFAG